MSTKGDILSAQNHSPPNTTMTQTQIDWTKRVQTKETPPRKVCILTTEAFGRYPVIGNIKGDGIYREWKLDGSYNGVNSNLDLKNTPEPPDPWAAEKAAFAAGEELQYLHPLSDLGWLDFGGEKPCEGHPAIKWRIKPKPQKVPLTPDDVPPGSVIRGAGEAKGNSSCWCMIVSSSETGIRIWRHCEGSAVEIKWESLMQAESQIWRPTDTSWMPCYKEVMP